MPETPAGGENTGVTGKTGNQGDEANQQAAADAERMAEAGRAARIPNYEVGGEKTTQLESSADKTFQENMEQQKYAHTFDFIDKLEKEREELSDKRTPEQKKKDARREKMAKIFAALGDGVAAMSNLVLASKGAIPYQSKSMVSKAVGDRYAQFRKDLEDRKAKYLAISERINELSEGVRKAKDAEEQRKAAQALAQAELAYKQYKDTRDFNYNKEKDDRQFNYNKGKDAADRKIRQQQADAATKNADANASRAATFARNGGRGTKYEFNGKTYGNVHAWGAAIKQKASQLGISLKEEYEAVDPLGFTRTHKRDKNIEQLLAEVNERMAGYSGFGF